MKKILVTLAFVFFFVGISLAVSTNYFELKTLNDFLSGESQWVEISALGKIRPGAAMKKNQLGEQQVWSILEHSSGSYFIATGIKGRVLILDKQGTRTVLETKSALVTSLVEGKGGIVYAGVAPGGEIYQINPDGSGVKQFCKLEDDYVWSLAVGADGTLFAGTGPKGMIFSIAANGQAKKLMDAKDDQVVRLAIDAKGRLLAGTAKKGALYRLDPANGYASTTLSSFSNQEISSLMIGPDDSVILGLNSLKIRAQKPQVMRSDTGGEGGPTPGSPPEGSQDQGGGPGPEALSGAKCQLVRLTKDGIVETLMQQGKMFITDVVLLKDGSMIIATGPEGAILSLSPSSELSIVNDLPESQASALAAKNGRLTAIGSSNPGVVYLVDAGVSPEAEFQSDVFDATLISQWGRISWLAGDPKGIAVETRSGAIQKPDDSWSKWELVKENGGQISSPAGEFIQFRIKWNGSTTDIKSVRIYYRQINQSPMIYEAAISSPKKNSGESSRKGADAGIFNIAWKVRNPDNDTLSYKLEYLREGQDIWVPITLDFFDNANYKWDTTEMPDGIYRLRILASDYKSNPPGMQKESRFITEPALVDNTKPAIKNLQAQGSVIIGSVADNLSVIVSLKYSVDGEYWMTIWPADGFFDQTVETFRIELKDLKPGKHDITIMAEDEGGNSAIDAITFTTK